MASTTTRTETEEDLEEAAILAEVAKYHDNPYVTPEDGRRMYDEAVRKHMGMSGEEFLRRWDAGEFRDIADKEGHRHIIDLVMMRSFAEQEP
jgi:hypothetical protein